MRQGGGCGYSRKIKFREERNGGRKGNRKNNRMDERKGRVENGGTVDKHFGRWMERNSNINELEREREKF